MRYAVRRPFRAVTILSALVVLVAAGCGSSSKASTSTSAAGGTTASVPGSTGSTGSTKNTASAPGITPTTITIGYVTSLTGASSSSYVGSQQGLQADLDAINAKGGVDGRQVKLIVADDQSTSTGNLTAVQSLVSRGVFGIVEVSNQDYGSGNYLAAQGLPITGDCCQDVPWGTYPNFFPQFGNENPNLSSTVDYTIYPNFYKSIGVTKVAGFGYSIAPSSQKDIKQLKVTLQSNGVQMPYENLTLPLGTTDFTTYALAMKSAGVTGGVCACVESSNLGMITAARQAGIDFKGAISQAGADGTVFTNASTTAALQGTYWPTFVTPLDLNTPATTAFIANLKANDPAYKASAAGQPAAYPTFGTTIAYLGADTMIHGLQLAGQNPTRKSFITAMRAVSSWNDNGLLPANVGWDHQGSLNTTDCEYFTKVEGTNFVTINNGKPFCGTLLPQYAGKDVTG